MCVCVDGWMRKLSNLINRTLAPACQQIKYLVSSTTWGRLRARCADGKFENNPVHLSRVASGQMLGVVLVVAAVRGGVRSVVYPATFPGRVGKMRDFKSSWRYGNWLNHHVWLNDLCAK